MTNKLYSSFGDTLHTHLIFPPKPYKPQFPRSPLDTIFVAKPVQKGRRKSRRKLRQAAGGINARQPACGGEKVNVPLGLPARVHPHLFLQRQTRVIRHPRGYLLLPDHDDDVAPRGGPRPLHTGASRSIARKRHFIPRAP